MNYKFSVKGSNANAVQKYLNTLPDSDVYDYQRTFVGNNAKFELIQVRDKEVFDSIIQNLKKNDLYPKIQENKMESRKKQLLENFIRREVRKSLWEYSSPISKGSIVKMAQKVAEEWNQLQKILGDEYYNSDYPSQIQNILRGDNTIYHRINIDKLTNLVEKFEEELTNQ